MLQSLGEQSACLIFFFTLRNTLQDFMSDIMQAKNLRRSSKFVEGRLKLSTSCVECHRRKQKCDRKQPCGHCARRYPPPPCIYRSHRVIPSSSQDEQGAPEPQSYATSLQAPDDATSNEQEFSLSSQQPIDEGGRSWLWRITPEIEQTFINSVPELDQPSISIDAVEKFGSNQYQTLITTMVSKLSCAAHRDSFISQISFLTQSKGGENKSSRILQRICGKNGQSNEKTYFGHDTLQHCVITPPSNFSVSAVDPLHYLGVKPTVQSAELLQVFINIITKYVVSIDGIVTPNYYNDYWVAWSIKSPLLAHVAILTAAMYQAEAQKTPSGQSAIALRYKVKSIEMLNEMLGDKTRATSTEAIAGVIFLLVNEWYLSNHEVVQRHMKGLKEMIRLRGGLNNLGMSGFLRKMIIHTDFNVACTYENEPSFPHEVSARPRHPVQMSIPFVAAERDFSSSTECLQIGTETAVILDDMRFLFVALIKHIDQGASGQEQIKLMATATWIRDRITSLPDVSEADSPLAADFAYKSCRIAALIYCKAIISRTSLSRICTLQDLNQLWANMWQVKLSRWKQMPGIFLFVILSALSAAETAPHGRFMKSMFKTTSAYIGLENFELVDAALSAFGKMQRWVKGGESGVERLEKPVPLNFIHIYEH